MFAISPMVGTAVTRVAFALFPGRSLFSVMLGLAPATIFGHRSTAGLVRPLPSYGSTR
jgi:hypothetical protein